MAIREGDRPDLRRYNAVLASKRLLDRLRHYHPNLDPRPKRPARLELKVPLQPPAKVIVTGNFGTFFTVAAELAKPKPEPKPEGGDWQNEPRVQDIILAVSRHFKIPLRELVSDRRHLEVVRPRQIAMYLSKKLTGKSLPAIGKRIGGRDHTTVLHAVRTIEQHAAKNPHLALQVEQIEQQIMGVA